MALVLCLNSTPTRVSFMLVQLFLNMPRAKFIEITALVMKQSDHTAHHSCCDRAGETCVVLVIDEHRNNLKEAGQIYIYLFELLFFLVPSEYRNLDLKMCCLSSLSPFIFKHQ